MDSTSSTPVRRTRHPLLAGIALLLSCLVLGGLLVAALRAFLIELDQALAEGLKEACEQIVVTMDFQGNLKVGNIHAAYDLTSEEFRSGLNQDEFAQLVENHPELRWSWVDSRGEIPTTDSCTYTITAEAKGGQRSAFQLQVKKEMGAWKIDRLTCHEPVNQLTGRPNKALQM